MKIAVVPELSDRWTTRIGVAGRLAWGLRAVSSGSFHFVIFPAKILPSSPR